MDIWIEERRWSYDELMALGPLGIEKLRREVENLTSMSQDEQALDHPVTGEMIALLLVLSLFTIVGSVGNGLVLFVFSRVRDKTTAQLFMLALALIDLFTCMVIIPFTMFVEYTRYDIKYDFLCKLYQFLITCKVPLSAFIMVAIGFDRYFCICHPLRKIITPWRTKVIIVSLTLFASMLGMMTSLAYSVYQVYVHNPADSYSGLVNDNFTHEEPENIKDWTKLGEDPSIKNDVTMKVELRLKDWLIHRNFNLTNQDQSSREIVYIGICAPSEILLEWGVVSVYQKCYTALFLICLVIVGIIYALIYRFIGIRRNKKLQQRLVLCAYVNGENGCGEAGTRTTMLNGNGHDNHHDDEKSTCAAQGLGAGGVYIGGCTTPTAPAKSPASLFPTNNGGVNVSFFGEESESGKPAVFSNKDEKKRQGLEGSKYRIGNSHTAVNENDCSKTNSCAQNVLQKNSENARTFPGAESGGRGGGGGESQKNVQGCENCSESEGRRENYRKSPSPNSRGHSGRRGLCKNNRRPKSVTDDPRQGREDARSNQPLWKRRGSSPYKNERCGPRTGPCDHRLEMRSLRTRRDSEPLRSSHDTSPLSSRRGSRGWEGDVLTMGSRNSYTMTYLETSIEEDFGLFDTGSNSGGPASLSSGKTDLDFLPEDRAADSDVCNNTSSDTTTAMTSANDSEESRVPLLHDSSRGRCRRNVSEGGEGDKPSVWDSGVSSDSPVPPPHDKDPHPHGRKEDSHPLHQHPPNSSGTLNNRSLLPGSQQQVLLTAYVRNLSSACSTSSANLSPPPSYSSYSDASRRSTMETDTCRRPHTLYTSQRSLGETSQAGSRSPSEAGCRRPSAGRKKRWQHFRFKNASIKGTHGRHKQSYVKANANHTDHRNRSIMSYDADRLREENRAANARTALMLFTVTLVFVVAFLPAWLMAHRLVSTQLLVFYLYFTYNVANPFIYAFMNVIFKEHLRKIFTCRGRR